MIRAQTPSAAIVGIVEDSTGGVLPGATLQIRNLATNETRAVESGDTGEFTAVNLQPGVYEIVVGKPGFQSIRETGLELQIDQTARLEFKLPVGSVNEYVEVTAAAPLLNTENAAKGEVMVSAEIVEMPLNGRDFGDLALLVPGVMRRARGGQGSAFAINGARGDNTNFIVDGFNDQNPRGGAAQVRPNLDAMQEFKMQTSNYSAEHGRLAGGVMNMVLKSGGNQLHGVLFEFLRNDKLDARDFFDANKSRLRRNQFGGTLNGPVTIPKLYQGKNRTFFLLSWESYRQTRGVNKLGLVPTDLERTGDFSASPPLKDPLNSEPCSATNRAGCFPDNVIPPSRIHSVSASVTPFFPRVNRPGQRNNFAGNALDHDEWDSLIVKIDEHLSSKDNLSYRFLKRFNRTSNPYNGDGPGTFGNFVRQRQSLMGLTWTRMFTPTLINETRVGFSRTADRERGVNQDRDYAAEFGIPGTTTDPKLIGFPRFTVRDLLPIGDGANMPVEFTVNNIQTGDTLTWVRGKHIVKVGGEILRTQFFQPYYNNNRGTFNFLGRWTGVPYADFLLGLPESTSRQVGTTPNYLFSTNYGFFAQDDWKIGRSLTLNLGVRYEIMKPPKEKYGRYTNFIPEFGRLVLADDATLRGTSIAFSDETKVGTARELGLPDSLVYTRYGNIAPRLGFAWRPFGGTSTVVRSGYGIFYGNSVQNPVRNDLANVFPFAISQTFNRRTTDPNYLTFSNPFPNPPNLTGNVVNVNGYELRARSPYLQSWNLTIEREIGRGSAFEIAYVGSKGTHLGRRYDLNQPFRSPELQLPNGQFPRPYEGVSTINFYGFHSNSNYNAGMVSFRRRFTNGFFYRVNYTLSKSIDDASQISGNADGGYPGAQDARNLRGDRGRSDWDTRHGLTMNFSWQAPRRLNPWLRGWQLSGTGRAFSGQPFTPRVSNVNLNLGEANRPDRIAPGRALNPSVENWFDLSAFPVVPAGSFRFGSSGRNILEGPGELGINLSLVRNWRPTERTNLQLRWETFNLMNHPNLHVPNTFVNAANGGTIDQSDPARQMQFGLRIWF